MQDCAEDGNGFLRQLRPRAAGDGCYAFVDESGGRRMFGGITIAQALVAAAQTVDGLIPHELHTLFLRPHVPGDEVRYRVERLRDGRRFAHRRVQAIEGDRLLSDTTVSFAAGGPALAYQATAPAAPRPEDLPDVAPGEPAAAEHPMTRRRGWHFDQRLVRWVGPRGDGRNLLDAWVRVADDPGDDLALRAATLAAISDLSTQLMGLDPDALPRPDAASLNHALWLHALPPLDDWLFTARESTVAADGRVMMTGAFYTRTGVRCASMAQESFIAPPQD